MLGDIYNGISENHVRTLLLAWLLEDNLPLSTVTTPAFRRFLAGLSPTLSAFIPRSGSTVRRDLEAVVRNKMPEACSSIQRTISKIHLVFDAWSSPNRASVLGVVERYVNEQYKLHTHLLSLTEIPESHTGINLTERIFTITERFKTSKHIGFVVSDNANNMNSCIDSMEISLQTAEINWTKRYHHIHYLAHTIHITATAFFFPCSNAPEDSDDSEVWRQFACFGKLHNIVKWIKASPGCNGRWKQVSDLMLLQDNKTRWNSWYDMCEWAIRPDVRGALVIMINNKSEFQLDFLLPTNFNNLISLTQFLKPFRDWTIQTEKIKDSLDMVLFVYDTFLSHLEESQMLWGQNEFMIVCVEASWSKLNKYYGLTDNTSTYFTATILNPTLKMAYFEQKWKSYPSLAGRIKPLKKRIIKRWRDEYQPALSAISQPITKITKMTSTLMSIFTNIHESLRRTSLVEDELELYLQKAILIKNDVPNINHFQALNWWYKQHQHSRYPHLHHVRGRWQYNEVVLSLQSIFALLVG